MRSVVIVGASVAGLSAAKALRRQGFDGTITLIGDELHRPYQRPPLSKQLLGGTWDRARLDLPDGGDLHLDWILGTAAVSLNLASRVVTLHGGRRVRFDGLVIATGARARKPRWHAELRGVFTLRTVDDALALRAHVAAGHRNVAIVGAGFIGCETAATLRGSACEVTLIDFERLPMLRALGESLGGLCRELHDAHGVRTVFGAGVEALLGRESVEGVRLADGSLIEADCVVVGAGVTPNVEWLAGSGLVVDNGVVCDSTCIALGSEGVVAAGDVARWQHPHYGRRRIEHWNNAIAQADAAASTLLAVPRKGTPYAAVPFFWSDQYDCKLQLIGAPATGDATRVVEGALGERRFVMLFERDGRVSGAFLFNSMHRVAAYMTAVEAGLGRVAEGVAQ